MNASISELEEINLIGPQISKSIVEYFNNAENQFIISTMKKYGVNMNNKTLESDNMNTLKDKRFVITGKLNTFTRSEITNTVKNFGGSVSSKVSSQTDYLIAGTDSGSKLSEAIRLQIPIINESDFLLLIKPVE